MTELSRSAAIRQLRVTAFLIALPSFGYLLQHRASGPRTAVSILALAIAVLGAATTALLWTAHPACRKAFALWCSLAAAWFVVQPQLPGDTLWSGVVAVLLWVLLAILARQVVRASSALFKREVQNGT